MERDTPLEEAADESNTSIQMSKNRGVNDIRMSFCIPSGKSNCWCYCNLRNGIRTLCIIYMLFLSAGVAELMKGGQYALILLIGPPLLIFVTTVTNDVKLAKLSLATNHVITKIILIAGLGWIILLWLGLDFIHDVAIKPIVESFEYFETLKNYFISRLIYYAILIFVSFYFDYAMTNWVKLLTDRDYKTMGESEELFNYYGDGIQVEDKEATVDEDIKKCFCLTGISGKSCGDNLRTRMQTSAFSDIVAKIAIASLIDSGKGGHDQSFYLLMSITSVFLLITSYNESYKLAKFAYWLNTISMYIMLVGNIFFITQFIILSTKDMDREIFSLKDELTEDDRQVVRGINRLYGFCMLCYHIFKILILTWTCWNLYALNGTVYSFMKSVGNRDYERLDGLHHEIRNVETPLSIIEGGQSINNEEKENNLQLTDKLVD
jgi:hypothetical protein